MQHLNRHQSIAQRLIGLIRGDSAHTFEARQNAIRNTLSEMAEHLSDLPLPVRDTWSGRAALNAEAQQALVDQGQYDPMLRRAQMLSTIRNIQHSADAGERGPDSLRLKELLDLWGNRAQALSEVADTTTANLTLTYHDLPLIETPLSALGNVGLHNKAHELTDARPMDFDLKYERVIGGERAQHIGEAVEAMVAANATDKPRSEIRVAIDPHTGESLTIRHSTDAPETLKVSAYDRAAFRVPVPSFTEGLDTHDYGAQLWHFAQNRPLNHGAISQTLDVLDRTQRDLEMTDVHTLIESDQARDNYKSDRGALIEDAIRLAQSLNPYSSEDRSAILMWSSLMTRLGVRDDLAVRFATDKTDHTIPQAMVPSTAYALTHDEQGGCQCTLYRNDEHLGNSPGHKLDPAAFQDERGAFDQARFADTLRSMGIASIRGPIAAWRDEPDHSPEQSPVHLITDRGMETIGQCVWGDTTDGTRLSAYQATKISQQRGDYNAFRFNAEADDQLGTMYFAQALGVREALTGNDLSIADERASDMDIEGTPSARVDLHFPGYGNGTFSDSSALGTEITRLDLVHHDHANLRHRIEVAAATADIIDSETRHEVVFAIDRTAPSTLDAYIDAAHSEMLEPHQSQSMGQ